VELGAARASEDLEDGGQAEPGPSAPTGTCWPHCRSACRDCTTSQSHCHPQAQTCPAPSRSFTGLGCQGRGQTGLRNTNTNSKLSPLFLEKVPDLAHLPSAKKGFSKWYLRVAEIPCLCQGNLHVSLSHIYLPTNPPLYLLILLTHTHMHTCTHTHIHTCTHAAQDPRLSSRSPC
jgi:hypothetical protein